MSDREKRFSDQPLKGMEDFYPSDMRLVNWILDNIKDVMEYYNYEEYLGPLLEPIEIFAAKSSIELVNEQAFIITDKNDRKLILRPEMTPTLARMIARKNQEIKKPIRWFSLPTCYRYEAPQKGRRREFIQFNADILGENTLYAELEIFNIIVDLLTSFGATSEQFQIYFNNRRLIDAICGLVLNIPKEKMSLVYKTLDKADKMDESEFEKWLLDSFQDESVVQGILKLKDTASIQDLLEKFENIPKEFYESIGYKELILFENLLKNTGLSKYCSFSSSIVRGLDYYTGTVFEVLDTGIENRRAIFGGGRYDDLLSLFSDEPLSGIGFGMGILMLSLFLKSYNLIPEEVYEKDYSDTIYIASINEKVATYAFKLARIVREDFPCIIDYRFKNMGNQLSKANELGVLISLIIGPNEMEQNKVTIRNMISEEQKAINVDDLIEEIYRILDEIEEDQNHNEE